MQIVSEREFLSFVEEIANWDSTWEKLDRKYVFGISL